MASEVKVTNRSTVLIGIFVGSMAVVVASGAAQLGGVFGALLVVLFLGLAALAVVRGVRMAVIANADGVIIHNFGRDYEVAWAGIDRIEAGRSDNVTGAVTTLYVRRTDGSGIVARAASSYSHAKVERYLAAILSARPGSP